MAIRSINHPGVEIREIDRSQYQPAIVGTYATIFGFADKGEDLAPNLVGNMQDFNAYYGTPTNEAERYSYYASSEVLKNGGSLIFGKIPYTNTVSTCYQGVALKVNGTNLLTIAAPTSADVATEAYLLSGTYQKAAQLDVTYVDMSIDDYDAIAIGSTWTTPTGLANNDFVIVNENRARLQGDGQDGGIFIKIITPLDAMKYQRVLATSVYNSSSTIPSGTASVSAMATLMDTLSGIYTRGTSLSLTDATNTFVNTLVDDVSGSSISENLMAYFPTIEVATSTAGSNVVGVNPEYSNYISVLVCQTYADKQEQGKLSIVVLESFTGSLKRNMRDKATGQSVFICDIVNAGSNYVKMYQNPQNPGSDSTGVSAITNDDCIVTPIGAYAPSHTALPTLLGFTQAECVKNITQSTVLTSLDVMLEKLSNIDDQQVDLVVDAGLSTIAQYCSGEMFIPDTDTNNHDITAPNATAVWRAVCDKLTSFCRDTRKDCMAILDVPRNLVMDGAEKYIRKTAPTHTFGTTIGRNLRYCAGLNSSYAALYSNWFRMIDDYTAVNFWIPESVKVVGVYCYNDTVANIWDAPAGLNRGVVNGVNDISFNPSGKDADQLYLKSFNYAKLYPLDGFIVEGQKTTQVKPSAFDRVNVRRMFLRLERLVYQQARYFVYEPNNLFTRRRLVDTVTPIFTDYRARGGMYDFRIVCDETNNTPDVIDRNELKIAFLVKPVKTAEFILCDFIATRTGANFNEVLQEFVG